MPRYNVEIDGKWACFSSVSDGYVTPLMNLDDYEKWRDTEYGRTKTPLERANRESLLEALRAVSLTRTDAEIVAHLRKVGIFYDAERDGG